MKQDWPSGIEHLKFFGVLLITTHVTTTNDMRWMSNVEWVMALMHASLETTPNRRTTKTSKNFNVIIRF